MVTNFIKLIILVDNINFTLRFLGRTVAQLQVVLQREPRLQRRNTAWQELHQHYPSGQKVALFCDGGQRAFEARGIN